MSGVPEVLLPFACFPDISYFCWLVHAPTVHIELHETYPRQTCRNRYIIATANGPLTLSVPVIRSSGNHTPFTDIKLSFAEKWNSIHWRAIESAYNKSPFFLYYRDVFESIFSNPPEYLWEFNKLLLEACLELTGIKPLIHFTDTFVKDPAPVADLRKMFMPKREIRHEWEITSYEPYFQVFGDRFPFIPNLSMADLLFNLGPEAAPYLRRHIPGQE
jgi:hypothetical protein